ncbi:LysM peptidoglycan-binding domain-containing protein [Candidatus Collierbacteria bacterium]|nr:LysM peptidoglycan-binding domain-containing protein [Candidatus Collierbacteria bacterium]
MAKVPTFIMEQQIKSFLKSIRSNESVISTLLGVAVVITIGSLLFNYFKSKPQTELPQNDVDISEIQTENFDDINAKPSLTSGNVHEVQAGETLWSIAERYFKSGYNWVDIATANKLKNGNLIEKGQKLTIPEVSSKKQTISVKTETKSEMKIEIKSADSIIQAESEYEIKTNDSLWKIAVSIYGDGYQWVKIYQANKTKIGRNPNLLISGAKLWLPK